MTSYFSCCWVVRKVKERVKRENRWAKTLSLVQTWWKGMLHHGGSSERPWKREDSYVLWVPCCTVHGNSGSCVIFRSFLIWKPSVVCLLFPFYGSHKMQSEGKRVCFPLSSCCLCWCIKTENILNSTHSDNHVGRMIKHCCVYWWSSHKKLINDY